jgi:DNA-binding IclR family transcriptional regulator
MPVQAAGATRAAEAEAEAAETTHRCHTLLKRCDFVACSGAVTRLYEPPQKLFLIGHALAQIRVQNTRQELMDNVRSEHV